MAATQYPGEPSSIIRTYWDQLIVVVVAYLGALLTAFVVFYVFQLGPLVHDLVPTGPYDAAVYGVVLGMTFAALPPMLENKWGVEAAENADEKRADEKEGVEEEENKDVDVTVKITEPDEAITVDHVKFWTIMSAMAIVDVSVLLLAALFMGSHFGPSAALLVPLIDKTAGHKIGYSLGLTVIWGILHLVQGAGLARDIDPFEVRGFPPRSRYS